MNSLYFLARLSAYRLVRFSGVLLLLFLAFLAAAEAVAEALLWFSSYSYSSFSSKLVSLRFPPQLLLVLRPPPAPLLLLLLLE